MELKVALRRAALARRRQLSDALRAAASARLAGYAGQLTIGHDAVVSGFWPIRDEIDPLPLMHALEAQGMQLALPAVVDATTIEFRLWRADDELVDTGFGTRGPGEGAEIVDPDLLLVPAAVFDRQGGRVGYGAGFYDRAIAGLVALGRNPRLVGVAFSCQEVDTVPLEPHDQVLDMVATERELIICERG